MRSKAVSWGCRRRVARAGIAGLAIALGSVGWAAPAAAVHRVYVANIGSDSVAVLDVDSRVVLRSISVGSEPDGIAVSPDGSRVYVSNFASDSVSVIDTASDTVVATIAVGDGPVGLAVHPSGNAVYVANKGSGNVSVIDALQGAVVATIDVGAGTCPNALVVAPDGDQVWVTRSRAGQLAVIDSRQQRVVDNIELGSESNRIALAGGRGRAYVATGRCFDGGPNRYKLILVDVNSRRIEVLGPLLKATDVVVQPGGRALFSAAADGTLQRWQRPGVPGGSLRVGSGLAGLAVVPQSGLVVVANPGNGEVAVVPADFDGARPPQPVRIALGGAPFAIAALPQSDSPPLNAAIVAPPPSFKLDPDARASVRISVADGTVALRAWRLTLRGLDSPSPEEELASGTAPLVATAVAKLDATQLQRGGTYLLTLEAEGVDGQRLLRDTRFTVPDRHYVLVPLDSQVDIWSRYQMDAAGQRFAAMASGGEGVTLYDAGSGKLQHVNMPARLRGDIDLSRDGRRLVASSPLTVLDLDTRQATVLSYAPRIIDVDTSGRWIAGFTLAGARKRYELRDLLTGERIRVSNVPFLRYPPPICTGSCSPFPWMSNGPHLSADGKKLVFVSGIDLGFANAGQCNIFSYDRDSGAVHLVRAIDDVMVDLPSLDDAGAQLGMLQQVARDQPSRAVVVDLANGVQRDVLAGNPAASTDAMMVGDGSGIVISSCADLDPSVGNDDGNPELFRVEFASGRIRQITDTIGGGNGCALSGGGRYGGGRFRPEVSRDGQVAAFNLKGEQSDVRTGLRFGAVRAVPLVSGNAPPRLDAQGTLATLVNGYLEVSFSATDPDGDPVSLFAQMDGNPTLPYDSSFSAQWLPAYFFWSAPPADSIGQHTLMVGAFDGRGGESVRRIPLAVCRQFVSKRDRGSILMAIFDPQAPGCGSADANGDGVVSAADFTAP
ncbi:MAG: beta-propeller fold lactonase family protein [bacterium]